MLYALTRTRDCTKDEWVWLREVCEILLLDSETKDQQITDMEASERELETELQESSKGNAKHRVMEGR